MTTNGTGKTANFNNIVYDSGNNASTGRKRVAISATEIELLDDIPPMTTTDVTSSRNASTNRIQQNSYQTLSLHRGSSKPNVVYQDENNPQVHSAFDKLIEKYAPDAIPANLVSNSNSTRRPPPPEPSASSKVNAPTTQIQSAFSAFQTTSPPSSTASHNYSTIVRSANNQPSQNPNQSNTNNFQTSTRPKSTNYDSFQHVVPPQQQAQQRQQPPPPPLPSQPQQQQQQPIQYWQAQTQPQQQQQQQSQSQFQSSIPIRTKDGNITKVVPGKLYNLDEDPLHLLFDRQNPIPSGLQQQQQQQSQLISTFQPSINIPTTFNPSSNIYSNISEEFAIPTAPMTTNSNPIPNANGIQKFDLGNLIKRVQQDYLREIEPFVSSVKFVEKDQEYGQNISDIGFTTPVTVRKGFRTQADDILRRSFNRQDRSQPKKSYGNNNNNDDENTFTESDTETYTEDTSELTSLDRREKIKKKNSKDTLSSITSITTSGSDSDSDSSSERGSVACKGTSPPPQAIASKSASKHSSIDSFKNTVKSDRSDDERSVTPTPTTTKVKQATRLPSNDQSTSRASDSDTDSVELYNETDPVAKSQAISTLIAGTPIIRSNETARDNITGTQAIQRSEDIHPTPPTIRPGQTNSQAQPSKNDSDLDKSSASDDEEKPAVYNDQLPAATTGRDAAATGRDAAATGRDAVANIPGGRGAPPAATGRDAVADIPSGRGAPPPAATTTNSRDAVGQSSLVSMARTTAESGGGRQPGPNIHFVPPDQRAAANERGGPTTTTNQPTTTAGPTQTGSTRFFQTDNDAKSGSKRTIKELPSTIGSKLKSIFSRK